jgi:hypothetical protein
MEYIEEGIVIENVDVGPVRYAVRRSLRGWWQWGQKLCRVVRKSCQR